MKMDHRLIGRLKAWREDPILFVKDNFKAVPDDWQAEFLLSVRDNRRTGAKACKGPGKSCGMSWVGWWFLATHPHARGFATSITAENLRDNLWAEFARWRKQSPFLTEYFDWSVERLFAIESPETWYISARTWPKQADKTQQANSLAGLHERYTIVIVDECGDIPSGVLAAADASLSTGIVNRIVIAGNPTRNDGPLYDACHKNREFWNMVEITGDPDDPRRSKRIDIEWAREQIKIWGRDHDWVKVNILGQFPSIASDKLLGRDICDAAAALVLPPAEYADDPLIMGVDVARFGDDRSVVTLRQGKVMHVQTVYRQMDLMSLATQIAEIYRDRNPLFLFVDETGIGAGVVDRLRQLGIPVVGVNFGSKPRDPRYADKRSEMWGDMAAWVKKGSVIPNDRELIDELCAPSYYFTNNRLKLESKDDLKKAGQVSPDKADSLALTFAEPVYIPPWFGTDRWAREQKNLGRVQFEYDPYGRESR
jgi:phage terminase large subunit